MTPTDHPVPVSNLCQWLNHLVDQVGGDDLVMRETLRKMLGSLFMQVATTIEHGSRDEIDMLVATLRAALPEVMQPEPHTVGIWLSRFKPEPRIPHTPLDPEQCDDVPMISFLVSAYPASQNAQINTTLSDEWTHWLPLATVNLFGWQSAETRAWTIWKAAHDAIAALGYDFTMLWTWLGNYINHTIRQYPLVAPRMVAHDELVPVLTYGNNNRFGYAVQVVQHIRVLEVSA